MWQDTYADLLSLPRLSEKIAVGDLPLPDTLTAAIFWPM